MLNVGLLVLVCVLAFLAMAVKRKPHAAPQQLFAQSPPVAGQAASSPISAPDADRAMAVVSQWYTGKKQEKFEGEVLDELAEMLAERE